MTLKEAQSEIERLNSLLEEKETELAELRKRKPAGRRVHDETWQASYDGWVKLYESGMKIMDIVETTDYSRRTCYRYKTYYEGQKK